MLLRRLLYLALLAAFVLHNDIWWWEDRDLVLGMPIGLTYHIALCFAAALIMALLVRHAWPSELDVDTGESPR